MGPGCPQRTHKTPEEASACGRLSPSKGVATTPSEEAGPAPTREGRPRPRVAWRTVCGGRQHHSLLVTSCGPHFTDVETEAQGEAGTPHKVARQVPGLGLSPAQGCSHGSPATPLGEHCLRPTRSMRLQTPLCLLVAR